MLADFLYGLLLIVTAISFIGIFRLARRIRQTSGVPSERLFILTFALLALLAMVFIVLNSQLSQYRHPHGVEKKTEQQRFVERIYPPLAVAQKSLTHQVSQLNRLQGQLYKLIRDHPQQGMRLRMAYQVWRTEREGLSRLKQSVDRAVRQVMGIYRVSDKLHVESTFHQEAVNLEKMIRDRLDLYHESQLKVSSTMLDNVALRYKELAQSQQRYIMLKQTFGIFKSNFDKAAVSQLLTYAEKLAPEASTSLLAVSKQLRISGQKRQEVTNYALENPDLKQTLVKVTKGWRHFENKGMFYREQLLHAVQAHYLAIVLGVNKNDRQLLRLQQAIQKQAVALYQDLLQSRALLEKSYKTAPR